MHPLYYQARGLVGRPVYVHHISGQTYHGTLSSVVPQGIYLMHHAPGVRPVKMEQKSDLQASDDVSLVYSPLGFFAFGALTGLTLGALASPYYYW